MGKIVSRPSRNSVFQNVIINEDVRWGAEYLTAEGGKLRTGTVHAKGAEAEYLAMRWKGWLLYEGGQGREREK
jgi:hypothetical protein